MPASSAPLAFGKYRLLGRIGEGGMGVVYRAEEDTADGVRTVVVKRVRPELSRDPSFLRMMAKEARLGVLMKHPGLVPVIEAGEVDGEAYLVLEYVDGYDLAQIVDRAIVLGKQVPVGVACHVALEAALALDYAHGLTDEQGQPLVIAHRDISPSNLMVTQAGAVKLLDFGIAKAADGQDERTRTGVLKGKLAYLSPEQADGLSVDARSDLFSLGVVIMELLLERRLFRGLTDFDTLRRVREADVPRPRTLRADIDEELESVLVMLLQRRREDRPADARALVEALSPIVTRLGAGPDGTRDYVASLAPITRSSTSISHDTVAEAGPREMPTSHTEDPTEVSPRVKRRRLFSPRSIVAPVEAPGRIAAPRSEDLPPPSTEPRWKAYLASLPDGMASFPQCTIKAALLRALHDQLGRPPMPAGVPQEVRDLIDHPPVVSSYVSGVSGRLFLLALADELGVDDDAFIARTYENAVQVLAGPLYKVLFTIVSIDRLIRNASSRWGAFHRGIELTVPEHGRGFARGILRSPPGFEPILTLRMHVTGVRAALEAVGARDLRTRLQMAAPGEAHVEITWTP